RLRTRHFGVAEEASVDALGLQSLVPEDAGSVRKGERHHDDVADLQCADVVADLLDDADRFVPHHARAVVGLERFVGPEVGAADAGARDADHRVGRFLDRRVGDVLDPDVAGCVHDCSAHYLLTSVRSGACPYWSLVTCAPQLTGLPLASACWIAMCVMNRVGAAPCQWFSPGLKKTRSPGRNSSIGPPSRWHRPTPSVTQIV